MILDVVYIFRAGDRDDFVENRLSKVIYVVLWDYLYRGLFFLRLVVGFGGRGDFFDVFNCE